MASVRPSLAASSAMAVLPPNRSPPDTPDTLPAPDASWLGEIVPGPCVPMLGLTRAPDGDEPGEAAFDDGLLLHPVASATSAARAASAAMPCLPRAPVRQNPRVWWSMTQRL